MALELLKDFDDVVILTENATQAEILRKLLIHPKHMEHITFIGDENFAMKNRVKMLILDDAHINKSDDEFYDLMNELWMPRMDPNGIIVDLFSIQGEKFVEALKELINHG